MTMQLSDFRIGFEFYTETRRWRCTDVGSRVVVAVSLEPHEIVTQYRDDDGVLQQTRSMTDDPTWLHGPPYAVAERVFDEDDFDVLYATAADVPK